MSEAVTDRFPRPGTDQRSARDNPGVIARPPLIYLCSILIGLAVHLLWPLEVLPAALEATLGGPLILVAVVFFVLSLRQFRTAGTAVQTGRPTTVIIKTGPYRLSRNPIYLSFTVLQLGIAIWVNSVWLLGTLLVALVVISYGVIAREERYLGGKFGEEYLQYKASVRRWV